MRCWRDCDTISSFGFLPFESFAFKRTEIYLPIRVTIFSLALIILDENSSTQLHFDFRTERPTAINFSSSSYEQRATCAAINRQRTRAIMEAAQLTASRESFPVDVWNAVFARRSKQKDVPLISLERLGIHHDEDGMLSSDFLSPLTSGAEASPFFDAEWKVVYKLFDLRADGSLGKKIRLSEPESDRFEIQLLPAVLFDTLEKLSVLNDAGGHPTEIVGLSSNGDYLIAKQPLAFANKDYQKDREIATRALGAIVPPFTNLERQVAVIWLGGKSWLVSDLHHRNIMRDREGNPTIIDALIGPAPPAAQRKLAWLRDAIHDAQDVRLGRPLRKRFRFGDDTDDDTL
jgi:hypothetical protein